MARTGLFYLNFRQRFAFVLLTSSKNQRLTTGWYISTRVYCLFPQLLNVAHFNFHLLRNSTQGSERYQIRREGRIQIDEMNSILDLFSIHIRQKRIHNIRMRETERQEKRANRTTTTSAPPSVGFVAKWPSSNAIKINIVSVGNAY